MENNSTNQSQHSVIPTERSDEGSLTSVAFGPYGRRTSFREDKRKTNMSYADTLRETQQEEFPLLSEVTRGALEDPLTLMNAHTDDDGVAVPCAMSLISTSCDTSPLAAKLS